MSKPCKILYIAGCGRSGSTLLERILSQMEGWSSVGELRHVWERGLHKNQLCSCGRPFWACSFWQRVVQQAFGGRDKTDLKEVISAKRAVDRLRNIPRLSFRFLQSRSFREKLEAHGRRLWRLYEAVRDVSQSGILVDSSKDPSHGYVLATLPGVELHVVHLVRDSRAVAHSWSRKRRRPEIHWRDAYLERHTWSCVSRVWVIYNVAAHFTSYFASSYAQVRYEDMVRDTEGVIKGIVNQCGGPVSELPFSPGGTVELAPGHSVAGNPMRFKTGSMAIRLDEEWKHSMPFMRKALVTACTWPLLIRYGYAMGYGAHRT